MTQNIEEFIKELLDIYKKDKIQAKDILSKIPINNFIFENLMEFQKSGDCDLRYLARKLILKIPVENISYDKLVEFQKTRDRYGSVAERQ